MNLNCIFFFKNSAEGEGFGGYLTLDSLFD